MVVMLVVAVVAIICSLKGVCRVGHALNAGNKLPVGGSARRGRLPPRSPSRGADGSAVARRQYRAYPRFHVAFQPRLHAQNKK